MTPRGPRAVAAAAAAVVVGWLATRALVLWLLGGRHAWVTGDLDYYAASLDAVADSGLAATLVEYPLPGVVVVAVPWLLVEWGLPGTYSGVVVGLSMAADALFTLLLAVLAVLGGSRRWTALLVWLLAVPLLGATVYARFDLVPGLLAATALLLLVSHPRLAAALAAVATGLKLWPVVVLPALAAPLRTRRSVLLVTVAVGVLLAGVTAGLAGVPRLLTPLAWQGERGLQIESVAATPFMLARLVAPGSHAVAFTEHNAFEVAGPGVAEALAVAEVLSLLAAPALLGLWYLAWRRGADATPGMVAWLCLAAVSTLMVTSKVLSPQYLLWLLPLAAAATAVVDRRDLRTWAWVLLLATAATQVVFPERYADLTDPDTAGAWGTWALVLRNTLLLWLAVRAWTLAVGEVGRGRSDRALPSAGHR